MATIKSIEEKAKAYDEAVKVAKEWHTDTQIGIGFKANLEKLFPELKESEDEKIRKALIQIFNVENFENYDIKNEEVIAWLEKQCEQKSIEYPLCKTVKDKIDYYIVNHFTTDTVVKTDVNSIVKAMEEGVMIGMSEQKPAWSEEDEKMTKNLTSELYNLEARKLIDKETKDKYTKWLKSLRPQNHWKPSDEQIYELTKAVVYYTSHGFPNKILNELLKQLKNL